MKDISIKDLVKNNFVEFYYLRKQVAYYTIMFDDEKYYFPVPLEDIGDATLNNMDKAIMFMRYIRKALDENTFVKIISSV